MTWIIRATVLMVAASPCAVMISIPVTLVAALGTGARKGVLIKGGVYLEQMADVKVVAFDKTGTMTYGEPEVTEVLLNPSRPDGSPATTDELLAVAAAIEQHSEHPLGRAIVRHAAKRNLQRREIDEFQAVVGSGASARLDGTVAYVAKPAFFWTRFGHSLASLDADLEGCLLQGKTVVMVGDEKGVWGLIALRDRIRPVVKKVVGELRALGIERIVMLTGDNVRTAQSIAAEAGVDEVSSELRPEQKVERIVDLSEKYGPVLMVGDGVNDAPALAAASVGVAMGAAGTDVALETADVALMADDLEKLVDALRLAQRNKTVVRQNLFLSTLVITGLVIGALTGILSLTTGVIGHEISEFLVIASGLRMLRDSRVRPAPLSPPPAVGGHRMDHPRSRVRSCPIHAPMIRPATRSESQHASSSRLFAVEHGGGEEKHAREEKHQGDHHARDRIAKESKAPVQTAQGPDDRSAKEAIAKTSRGNVVNSPQGVGSPGWARSRAISFTGAPMRVTKLRPTPPTSPTCHQEMRFGESPMGLNRA